MNNGAVTDGNPLCAAIAKDMPGAANNVDKAKHAEYRKDTTLGAELLAAIAKAPQNVDKLLDAEGDPKGRGRLSYVRRRLMERYPHVEAEALTHEDAHASIDYTVGKEDLLITWDDDLDQPGQAI